MAQLVTKQSGSTKLFRSSGIDGAYIHSDGATSGGLPGMVYFCSAPQQAMSFNAASLDLAGHS